jgi:hypothetical protein
MNRIAPIFALAGALALGGCPDGSSPKVEQGQVSQARVYVLERCPGQPAKAPNSRTDLESKALPLGAAIATAILPALVDVSLDLLAGAVREAAKDKTERESAISTAYLHSFPAAPAGGNDSKAIPSPRLDAHPDFGCIVVVRALFKTPPAQQASVQQASAQQASAQQGSAQDPFVAFTSAWTDEFKNSRDTSAWTDELKKSSETFNAFVLRSTYPNYLNALEFALSNGLRTGQQPNPARNNNSNTSLATRDDFLKSIDIRELYFYFAANIEFSAEGSAFRLVPYALELKKQIENGGNPEIVLNVTLTSARSPRDGAPVAIVTLPLPAVAHGDLIDSKLLQGFSSGWTGFPGGDPVAKAALGNLQQAYAAIEASAPAARRLSSYAACLEKLRGLDDRAKNIEAINNEAAIPLKGNAGQNDPCLQYSLRVQRASLDAIMARASGASETIQRIAPVLAARVALAELTDTASRDHNIIVNFPDTLQRYIRSLRANQSLTPVTVEVDIIESRKGSPFMKALADVLDKSKKGVGDALVASLSPAERAKRQADEEQRTRTNRAAVATAQDSVRLRQAELDDLPSTATRAERVRAENALRQAKIAANNAYLADGRGIPYPDVQP